ncbi:MAG: hypothetical protein ABIJ09_24210 [Pseudomonadota bacterium]
MVTTSKGSCSSPLRLVAGGVLALALVGLILLFVSARRESQMWPVGTPPVIVPEPPLAVDDGAWNAFLALGATLKDVDLAWVSPAITALGSPPADALPRWKEHARSLDDLQALVARGGMKSPHVEMDDLLPPVIPFLQLGRLALLRAWFKASQGDPEGARDDLELVLRLGVLLEQASGSLLLTMVGLSLQDGLVDETGEILAAHPEWPGDTWLPLGQALIRASSLPPGMVASLALECDAQERMWRRFGGLSTWELLRSTGELQRQGEASTEGTGSSWFFDVDKTVAMTRYRCRRRLAEWLKPGSARLTVHHEPLFQGKTWSPGVFVDNPVGRVLLDIGEPSMDNTLARSDRVRARRALLGLRLGMLAFLQQHAGSYPASLGDLVPEVLPEVPVDPYSGEALVYDREAGTLASTGTQDDEVLLVRLRDEVPAVPPAQ